MREVEQIAQEVSEVRMMTAKREGWNSDDSVA